MSVVYLPKNELDDYKNKVIFRDGSEQEILFYNYGLCENNESFFNFQTIYGTIYKTIMTTEIGHFDNLTTFMLNPFGDWEETPPEKQVFRLEIHIPTEEKK